MNHKDFLAHDDDWLISLFRFPTELCSWIYVLNSVQHETDQPDGTMQSLKEYNI